MDKVELRQKDVQNYMMGGACWTVLGAGGLWIAMGNLIYDSIQSESKMDAVLASKKK